MVTPHRGSITIVLMVSLVSAPCAGTLFAAEVERPSTEASVQQPATSGTAEETTLTSSASIARALSALQTAQPLASTPRGLVPGWQDGFATELTQPNAFAGQVYRDRPIRTRRNQGSVAALVLGSIAAITGGALLVYANRPECSTTSSADGCGYGTKVVGGAVLTGGIAGLFIGALTWR